MVWVFYLPLNSPFRFPMYVEIASERSSEGIIMLGLAALLIKEKDECFLSGGSVFILKFPARTIPNGNQ